jgi:hypothetical protein
MRAWVHRHGWLGGLLALVLLFGQSAAVVYACERQLAALPAPAEAPAPLDGCAEHAAAATEAPPGHALLCKAHCQADQQSVNSAGGTADLPAGDGAGVLLWPLPERTAVLPTLGPRAWAQPAGPPAGAPPLYLALRVLRN